MANQNRNLPRINDLFPRLFTGEQGENPFSHWLKWEDYSDSHQLPNQQKIDQFKNTLNGEAREWISGKVFGNVNELKDQFTQFFSGQSSREASKETFRSLKYSATETLARFAQRVQRSAERLQIDNEGVIEQFLRGLAYEMRRSVVLSNAVTLVEMVRAGERYEQMEREKQNVSFHSTPQVYAARYDGDLDKKFEKVLDCLQSMAISQERFFSMQQQVREYKEFRSRGRSDSRDRFAKHGSRARSESGDRYSKFPRNRDRSTSRNRGDRFRSSNDRSSSREGRSSMRNQYRDSRNKSPYPNSPKRGNIERDECGFCRKFGHGQDNCYKLQNLIASGKLQEYCKQQGF